jgi:hypothetical protein
MEPVITTAAMIASLIFSKALERGGTQLGEKLADAASQKVGQLFNIIQAKFQKEGVEGKLTKAQEDPSDKNKERFERELAELMEDDEAFAEQLRNMINELEADQRVRQIFFKDINVKGDAEVGDIEQTATRDVSVNQEAVTSVEVGGNLKIGNVKQKS